MSFETRLMASIRGIEFKLEDADGNSGRRAVPHAYPKRNTGWTEDNGAVLTNQTITGIVVGDNYVKELVDILAALNKPGACELIHPWFGVQQVQVGKVSHKLVNKEDGIATFSFEVFEAGKALFPVASVDTVHVVKAESAASQKASNDTFEKEWNEDAELGAGDMIDAFLDDMEEFTRGLPSLPSELREWTDRLIRVKDSVGKLLAYPGELAREVMGLLEDVKSVVKDPIRSLEVYDQVRNRWDGARAELAITGGLTNNIVTDGTNASSVPNSANPITQAEIIKNSETFKILVLESAVVSKASALGDSILIQDLSPKVEVITGLTGADSQAVLTGQQLRNIGYKIADELAELAAQAVDSGSSSVWRQFRILRQAVLSDTKERAELLPQLSIYTPIITTPVALVAWRETGNTELRQSIVRRNGLKNPSFIQANDPIEVING
ncbi:DNA circularization protein [Aliivibrio wodanis]|uniref:DNA circularization protein n=1 Tax=Aliivibrio wodanis TaxID=80852 RepID=UPI00406C7478